MSVFSDDEWADSEAHRIAPDCMACSIGGVLVEPGTVWMLFFQNPSKFQPTAGLMIVAGTHPHAGFRLLGGRQAGRWVPADYVRQVDKMGPMLESIFRLGGGE